MTPIATPLSDRRRATRADARSRVAINLLHPTRTLAANSVNFSEGGMCLRLQEALEVRALVNLQFTPAGIGFARGRRRVACTGRVAWVVQRLDLRTLPPFLYDVGVEFVDPPPPLRQRLAREGAALSGPRKQAAGGKRLASAAIRGRRYIPRLERTSSHPSQWHLIVSVDGVPCFSHHYPSERAATAAWATFKRQQAKR